MTVAWVDETHAHVTCHNCNTTTNVRNLIDVTPLAAHEHHHRCPECGHLSHWHDPANTPTQSTNE